MWLFNLESVSPEILDLLYLMFCYFAIAFGGMLVIGFVIDEPDARSLVDEDYGYWYGVLAGPVEEGVFRGLPIFLFGLPGGVIGTALWAVAHVPNMKWTVDGIEVDGYNWSRLWYCSIMGIFFLRMWASGLWLEAIIVHSVWNGLVYGISAQSRIREYRRDWVEWLAERVSEEREAWLNRARSVGLNPDDYPTDEELREAVEEAERVEGEDSGAEVDLDTGIEFSPKRKDTVDIEIIGEKRGRFNPTGERLTEEDLWG